jgi:hypothetical protein
MTPRRTHPFWLELATPKERSKIDELDRSIADMRQRRQALINRVKLRTPLWVEHRVSPARRTRRRLAAG